MLLQLDNHNIKKLLLLVTLLTRQFTELSRFTVVSKGSSPFHFYAYI